VISDKGREFTLFFFYSAGNIFRTTLDFKTLSLSQTLKTIYIFPSNMMAYFNESMRAESWSSRQERMICTAVWVYPLRLPYSSHADWIFRLASQKERCVAAENWGGRSRRNILVKKYMNYFNGYIIILTKEWNVYSRNRLWRRIGFWDVEDPTFSR
jgi:hypothetical protein